MAVKKKVEEVSLEDTVQAHRLSTGVLVAARPMNSILIYDVQQQIQMPDVPLVQIKQRGEIKWVENPSDPDYSRRVEEVERKRNMAAMDVMIRLGIELVSPLPKDDEWLEELDGILDLGRYRNADGDFSERTKKYLYLRYVAIRTQDDYAVISRIVMPSEEEVSEAIETFQTDEA